jgi:hypothetical protein
VLPEKLDNKLYRIWWSSINIILPLLSNLSHRLQQKQGQQCYLSIGALALFLGLYSALHYKYFAH